MAAQAQHWIMAKRPQGEPEAGCFELVSEAVPEPGEGEVVVANRWLSLDPYMRGRMRDTASYAEPLQEGEIITGETAGVILASRSKKWQEGDAVSVRRGWRTHVQLPEDAPDLTAIDTSLAPMPAWLGVIGMPGRTAHIGLKDVGKPKKGETLVVSAASGAVGSVVGQIGKILGLRSVGIAGGKEKCDWCVNEAGFDACVDYKADNLPAALKAACPQGVDIYFENVGGAVSRAVAGLLNPGARVPICGYISLYNSTEDLTKVETPFTLFGGMDPKPEHRFFLVTEGMERWGDISRELAGWIDDGRIRYRETITQGFANAPEAFLGLFRGQNFGKQLVQID